MRQSTRDAASSSARNEHWRNEDRHLTDEDLAKLIYEAISETCSTGWISDFRIGPSDVFDGENVKIGIDTSIDMLALARALRLKIGI